ncbi:MAG: hypothetical protein HKO02_09490 [Hyphomonadaceae bacterium]|nr:hypothetical protein [Hyphomonadaceae bacterium]
MNKNITKEAILSEVLESGALGSSNHQIALFKYLLDAKFDGRTHEIKAYSIAVDVFGRNSDFDSSVDSIVRVEMFRLRANLKTFNQDSQKFRLELKKASYNIQIEDQSDVSETVDIRIDDDDGKKSPSGTSGKPRSRKFAGMAAAASGMVLAFYTGYALQGPKDRSHCSNILPNVSVADHSNAFDLDVYIEQTIKGAASQFSHLNIVPDTKLCRYTGTPGYELQYAVIENERDYLISISAISDDTKKIIASENFTSTLVSHSEEIGTIQSDELFFDIIKPVNDILKPNGIVAMHALSVTWRNKRGSIDFECIPIMYSSFVSDSDEDYFESLNCLENAYHENTGNMDNLGGLVASYFDQTKNFRPKTVDEPLVKIEQLMAEIGDSWSNNVETAVAKIYFEAEHPQYNSQRMRNTLMTAEKNFNTHPVVMLEVARHAGFRLGDWEYAKQISDRAMQLHSERDNSVFFIDASYALMHSNPKEGLAICVKTYSEHSKLSNLLVNACAIKADNDIWRARTEKNLATLGLTTLQQRVSFINNQKYDEVFKQLLSSTWNNLL